MSECVVRMEMPRVCITDNGYYGYCPMDRIWCIQRNAPPNITMREAYEAMTDKIPSWCPILCQLPEEHGRLADVDKLFRVIPLNVCVPCPFGEEKECRDCVIEEVIKRIDDAPTIVPADTAERSET